MDCRQFKNILKFFFILLSEFELFTSLFTIQPVCLSRLTNTMNDFKLNIYYKIVIVLFPTFVEPCQVYSLFKIEIQGQRRNKMDLFSFTLLVATELV